MAKIVIAFIWLICVVSSANAKADAFSDVDKVESCWLKCTEEAITAGERAVSAFKQQTEFDQASIDAYTRLISFYTRIYLERGDYLKTAELIDDYYSRSLLPTLEHKHLATIHTLRGISYYSTNQIVLAENAYKAALGIYQKLNDPRGQGVALNNLGNVSLERGKAAVAIDFYQQAIPLLEQSGATTNLATTLNNVGIQLALKDQLELAEQYIVRARELAKDSPLIRVKVQVIQAYLWVFIYGEKYQAALDFAIENQALIEDSELTALQSHFFFQLGTIQEALNQIDKAEQAFQSSLELAQQVNALNSVESASLGLAKLAGRRGDTDLAKAELNTLYENAIAAERFEFAEKIQTELIAVLSNDKQYEAAYLELSEYLDSHRDRVQNEQENEVSQYFALLETEEEKRKVVELQRDNAEKALELSLSESQQQKNLTLFIVIASVLVIISMFMYQFRRVAVIEAKLAQQLLTKKNELLSEISHELRTPLTAIKLQVETLEYELSTKPERTYALVYEKIASLNRLISDVFQLSKADSKELDLDLELLPAQQFVMDLVEKFEPQLQQSDISLSTFDRTESPALINIDPKRIEQVMANLFSNTTRYTDAPGQCQITLSKQKNTFAIRYEDSSPGVSDSSLGRLFERLFREDKSRNRALGGSGLGLSIAQAFIKAHGGSIKASHSELGGVCFDIHLPTVKSSSKAEES